MNEEEFEQKIERLARKYIMDFPTVRILRNIADKLDAEDD